MLSTFQSQSWLGSANIKMVIPLLFPTTRWNVSIASWSNLEEYLGHFPAWGALVEILSKFPHQQKAYYILPQWHQMEPVR